MRITNKASAKRYLAEATLKRPASFGGKRFTFAWEHGQWSVYTDYNTCEMGYVLTGVQDKGADDFIILGAAMEQSPRFASMLKGEIHYV